MEEIIEKLENLKKVLDKEECIKIIKKLNKDIINDKEIIELLEEYRKSNSRDIKMKLYENDKFRKYKDNEMEVNLLIMKINNKLKEINSRSSCNK